MNNPISVYDETGFYWESADGETWVAGILRNDGFWECWSITPKTLNNPAVLRTERSEVESWVNSEVAKHNSNQ